VTLFVIGVVYTLSGPVDWVYRRVTGVQLEELPQPPVKSESPQG
jgi:hypothetical protein